MDPPDLGALDLSDSDTDALFDTPAVRKTKKQTKDAEANAGQGAAGGKTRAKQSHYTTEEAREAALRRELESIRNVNKVIEGVVESLQKAKDNMAVRVKLRNGTLLWLTTTTDCIPYCAERVNPAPNMDANTVPDRAQPAPHPEPTMAGRITRPRRH
jgi:hypothetical protein